MSQDSYTRTNPEYRDRSGDLISHPPDDEDLSGFLTSQPRCNRLGANGSKTQQPNANDEDLSGCLSSGFLNRKKTTPIVSQNTRPTKREIATETPTDEDTGSGWLYLN
jgi:hypothetical protein